MPRLATVEPKDATGASAQILAAAPINIYKGLAAHPKVFEAFIAFMKATGDGGALSKAEKEGVMLLVSERRRCDYCLAAHTRIAMGAGLTADQALDARRGTGRDERSQAVLDFAGAVLAKDGFVSDDDLASFRDAGFTDQAVIEVVAAITVMTFTNLYNHVHETEIDFPAVPALA